jgi:hypothetical protein
MHEAEAARVEIALLGRNGGVLYTSKAAACLRQAGKTAALQILEANGGTPGGNADNDERKGLAGKAICKTMKTKGEQIALVDRL